MGTIRERVPPLAVDDRAMTGFPPFERAAPRMKFFVLGDDKRVVHVVDGVSFDKGVVVQKVVKFIAAQCECDDDLSWVQGFSGSRHHSPLDGLHGLVREHLGVDAQVEASVHGSENRIGNSADPHLDRHPGLDERENVPADGQLDLVRGTWLEGGKGLRRLDNGIRVPHVHERVP
jgi:hypothetical protein